MSLDEMTDEQVLLVANALWSRLCHPRAPYHLLAAPQERATAESLVDAGVFERGHDWADGTMTYRVKS